MKARVSGAWRDISSAQIRVEGVWRTITRVLVRVAGAWEESVIFAPSLSVTTTAAEVFAYNASTSTVVITTDAVTATPSGGLAPYTYAWTKSAGDSTASAPSSATTTFSRLTTGYEAAFDIWTITITDAIGQTATATVTAQFIGTN